jgi:hypothetical protein
VIPIVPVEVIVPPVIGALVAIDVTVPPVPVAEIVKLGYVPVILTPVDAVSATTWSGAVLVIVKFGYVPDTDIAVPSVSTTVWSGAEFVMVIVSEDELPVIVMPVPAVKVSVSSLLSATTVALPVTAKFLKMLWPEPLSVFSMVIVPLVVMGLPVMLRPPPFAMATLVTVPDVEDIVIVSVDASVVIVTPPPPARVSVSEFESATTLLCPVTAIVLNESDALLLNVVQSVELK